MSVELKTIESLDFSKYVELRKNCYLDERSTYLLYEWHFLMCPEPRRHFAAVDGDKILGMFSAFPIKIKYNSSFKKGSILTNGMLHPDYRGKNIFTDIMKYGFIQEEKNDTDIVLAVPSTKVFNCTVKSGMTIMGNLDFIGKFSFEKKEHNCVKIDSFNPDIDNFQNLIYQKSNFMVFKDSNFLNWRYVHRPDGDYQIYTTMNGNDISGWIVISNYDEGKYLKTHIVDMDAVDYQAFKELINCAESVAKERHELNCWQVDNSMYHDWFKREGFVSTTEKNILMKIVLKENIEKFTPSNWWFSLGDNDVY